VFVFRLIRLLVVFLDVFFVDFNLISNIVIYVILNLIVVMAIRARTSCSGDLRTMR